MSPCRVESQDLCIFSKGRPSLSSLSGTPPTLGNSQSIGNRADDNAAREQSMDFHLFGSTSLPVSKKKSEMKVLQHLDSPSAISIVVDYMGLLLSNTFSVTCSMTRLHGYWGPSVGNTQVLLLLWRCLLRRILTGIAIFS